MKSEVSFDESKLINVVVDFVAELEALGVDVVDDCVVDDVVVVDVGWVLVVVVVGLVVVVVVVGVVVLVVVVVVGVVVVVVVVVVVENILLLKQFTFIIGSEKAAIKTKQKCIAV